MWAQNVVASDPEGKVIVGSVNFIKAVRVAVRGFIGAVESFDHLFERAVFFRDGIIVDKSNLSPITCVILKVKFFPNFFANSIATMGIQ